jgi:hypothetical protein
MYLTHSAPKGVLCQPRAMPWTIMDQAVGLPALNGCFIDGIFFIVNHLTTAFNDFYASNQLFFLILRTGFILLNMMYEYISLHIR